jgi:hypothetical protein
VAKVLAAVQASLGLLIGACLSAVGLLAGLVGSSGENPGVPGWIGPMVGVGAVVTLPIIYGIIGFLSGLIGGALYNFFAGMVGGIVVEFDGQVNPQ